jgi:hypothetical protein
LSRVDVTEVAWKLERKCIMAVRHERAIGVSVCATDARKNASQNAIGLSDQVAQGSVDLSTVWAAF